MILLILFISEPSIIFLVVINNKCDKDKNVQESQTKNIYKEASSKGSKSIKNFNTKI